MVNFDHQQLHISCSSSQTNPNATSLAVVSSETPDLDQSTNCPDSPGPNLNNAPKSQAIHLYRGHRSQSLLIDDIDELTEWRARQRTFDGAYTRTALSCSVYALTILKIFHKDFAKIGLAYVGLALAILIISGVRRRRLNHDFADKNMPEPVLRHSTTEPVPKIWGREYRTPGDIVVMLTAVVAAIQVSVIVMISRLD